MPGAGGSWSSPPAGTGQPGHRETPQPCLSPLPPPDFEDPIGIVGPERRAVAACGCRERTANVSVGAEQGEQRRGFSEFPWGLREQELLGIWESSAPTQSLPTTPAGGILLGFPGEYTNSHFNSCSFSQISVLRVMVFTPKIHL